MSYSVRFKVNENFEVIMAVLDTMMIAELIYNFGQKVGLKEEHKPSFTFNFDPIKPDSQKKLKDLGIKENSIINVKTEKPLNYKPENFISMGMNMNNPGSMYMNPNLNNFGNMNNNSNMNLGKMNSGYMNMNPNMKSPFIIYFSLNGAFAGNMFVKEDMVFGEVACHFCENFNIKSDNESTFFYNNSRIKLDSCKNLKELGIGNMSKIEVKTERPINNPLILIIEIWG